MTLRRKTGAKYTHVAQPKDVSWSHLVGLGAEDELVDGGCEDSARQWPHPEDPLVVPAARDRGRSKGPRWVDAVMHHTQQQLSHYSLTTHNCYGNPQPCIRSFFLSARASQQSHTPHQCLHLIILQQGSSPYLALALPYMSCISLSPNLYARQRS